GYRRYRVLAYDRLWRLAARLRPALRWLGRRPVRQRGERFLRAVGEPDRARRMALLLSEDSDDPSPERVFSSEARARFAAVDPFARYGELARRLPLDPVQQMLATDTAILL